MLAQAPKFTVGEHVSDAERLFYQDYGFIVYGAAFSAQDVETIRDEAQALHDRTLAGEIPASDRDDLTPRSVDEHGNEYLHRLPYFNRYCPRTRELLGAERFQSLGRGHLGERAWMLEDTMHGVIWQMKRGGKRSSYSQIRWHVDFDDDHPLTPVMSAGIYLDRSTVENGCLAVVPGSHRFPPALAIPSITYHVEAEPGDIVCHAHNIYHGSGPALRESDRRATLYAYFCAGEHPGKEGLPFASDEAKSEIRQLFAGARA
jgi:ectoine hydroxylase-related dioxygenase (phytanoyl-CoA dioxygenase family)